VHRIGLGMIVGEEFFTTPDAFNERPGQYLLELSDPGRAAELKANFAGVRGGPGSGPRAASAEADGHITERARARDRPGGTHDRLARNSRLVVKKKCWPRISRIDTNQIQISFALIRVDS
jgi:hypothetical protein